MSKSVLVIDGNANKRQLLLSYLGDSGLNARAYSDARTALAAFRNSPYEYDLIVSDASLAHAQGLDFMREVRFIRPTVDVVLLSERDWSRIGALAQAA